MPNIWKRLSGPTVELFRFPDADEIVMETPKPVVPEQFEDEVDIEPAPSEPEPTMASDPIGYAQIQADSILRDARHQAEEILDKARVEAELEASRIFEEARQAGSETGYTEGLRRGLEQAAEDNEKFQEEQAAKMGQEVKRFLERAGDTLDRQLDENVSQLRDLAIAVAEKVICISLKTSEGVIGRMIQTALEKRKRREWVHIYIAECDAKTLSPMPASLASALTAVSDRVRIIPMSDDESGTCIIEMPNEIVDASVGTQLNNIRNLLQDVDRPIF